MSTRLMRTLARCLLAAMLLAALAPAISRTLAGTRGAGDWVEICSPGGMRWAQLQAPGTGALQADDLLHALDHCAHCGLAAERFAPLLPTLPVVAALTSHGPPPPTPPARPPRALRRTRPLAARRSWADTHRPPHQGGHRPATDARHRLRACRSQEHA